MDGLIDFEILFTTFMQNLGGWLETPMEAITFLGGEMFSLLIMPALYWSIDAALGFRAGMMLVISGGLNTAAKMLIHTPRPFWVDGSVKAFSSETSFGLPSGHSQNSAAIWGMVGKSINTRSSLLITAIFVFLIGVSRIYLGVHFLHDVLTGWLFGILIVIIYLKLESPVEKYLKTKGLSFHLLAALLFSLFFIGLGLIGLAISQRWSLPADWVANAVAAGAEAPDPFNQEGMITIAGVTFGFLAGYALWRDKFGVYVIKCSAAKRLARYFVSLIGILILYFGLKVIFPEEPLLLGMILRYVRYALIGLWVTFLAPLIFKKMRLDV